MSDIIILLLLIIIVIGVVSCMIEKDKKVDGYWTINDLIFMSTLIKNLEKGDYKVVFLEENGLGFYINDVSVDDDNKIIVFSERSL